MLRRRPPRSLFRRAGVYVLETGGLILPRTTAYLEAACTLAPPRPLHPFAFRVHTHALGRVVSGWKVTEDMEWSLIGKELLYIYLYLSISIYIYIYLSRSIYAGKEDPQKPQMFYPVEDSAMTLTGGDTVAARCTMVSYRDRITWVTNIFSSPRYFLSLQIFNVRLSGGGDC